MNSRHLLPHLQSINSFHTNEDSPPREVTKMLFWLIHVCLCGMNESGMLSSSSSLLPPPFLSWRWIWRKHHKQSRDILRVCFSSHIQSITVRVSLCVRLCVAVWVRGKPLCGWREGFNSLRGITAVRERTGRLQWPCSVFISAHTSRTSGPPTGQTHQQLNHHRIGELELQNYRLKQSCIRASGANSESSVAFSPLAAVPVAFLCLTPERIQLYHLTWCTQTNWPISPNLTEPKQLIHQTESTQISHQPYVSVGFLLQLHCTPLSLNSLVPTGLFYCLTQQQVDSADCNNLTLC